MMRGGEEKFTRVLTVLESYVSWGPWGEKAEKAPVLKKVTKPESVLFYRSSLRACVDVRSLGCNGCFTVTVNVATVRVKS